MQIEFPLHSASETKTDKLMASSTCLMKTLPTLLLVDDDPEIRDQMKWALASDYELLEASDRPSALSVVRQAMAQIILLDLGLPPDTDGASEGLAVLSETLQIRSAGESHRAYGQ